MQYRFKDFVLDTGTFELTRAGALVPVEPQVFSLLKLLIENRHRLVSKDEIVLEVWDDRVVSDASIATRIKSARSAVADDGNRQKIIRTIHGQGFRFVASVEEYFEGTKGGARVNSLSLNSGDPGSDGQPREPQSLGQKPSIAVLPFQILGTTSPDDILADAIPHDLIQALSRLRWLFVIARGSTFRFRSENYAPDDIRASLGVRYLLTGTVEPIGGQLIVSTELSDTRTGGVLWGERFTASLDDIHQIRQDIVARVVSSLEIHIPLQEAQDARLSASENLDAWSNYHLGLQHMYRFTFDDNASATGFFSRAVEQDPGFARAYAGLSFTSFQSAFLKYRDGRLEALADARRFAERGVELDPLDAFATFTLGRALMLAGDLDGSAGWLNRSITLSPNYSQGYYGHAFSDMLAGKTASSLPHFDAALSLSPLDPFTYAMLAGRSLSHVIEGDYEKAAEAGENAARSPGSHFIVDMIALVALTLNGSKEKARLQSERVRKRRPDASQALFFESMPFPDEGIRNRISGALAAHGF